MPEQIDKAPFVAATGRPRLHASDSSRLGEFRSKHGRIDVPVSLGVARTIDALASDFGCSKAVVVRSLLRFALTNRDWKKRFAMGGLNGFDRLCPRLYAGSGNALAA